MLLRLTILICLIRLKIRKKTKCFLVNSIWNRKNRFWILEKRRRRSWWLARCKSILTILLSRTKDGDYLWWVTTKITKTSTAWTNWISSAHSKQVLLGSYSRWRRSAANSRLKTLKKCLTKNKPSLNGSSPLKSSHNQRTSPFKPKTRPPRSKTSST